MDGAFVEGRSPAEIDAELAGSDAGRGWLDELEQIKDPWFNMGTGDGLYHYYGSWHDDPSIPYASLDRARRRRSRRARTSSARPRSSPRSATAWPRSTARCCDEEARPAFQELLGLSRTVFPYVEEHKFYCDYWFQSRFFNKVREFGALLAKHGFLEEGEDIFNLSRHEAMEALEELSLTWSTGGPRARAAPLAADRRAPQAAARAARRVDAAARARRDAGGGERPDRGDALGHHARSGSSSGRSPQEGSELGGAAASPGEVEGPARVVRGLGDLDTVRPGEILVCTITSPAWAPIFSKIVATVTDIGGIMSHAAIVSREYGLPAVVGTGTATSRIKTGQRLRVNGSDGRVTILDGTGLTAALHTRPLADLRAADEALFGGKSASLGELIAARASRCRPASRWRARRGPRSTREIAAAYEALGATRPVAVRSSAIGEDSAETTFAGLQDTYLWVRGAEQVCAAVRDCWASLDNPEAVSYRERHGSRRASRRWA